MARNTNPLSLDIMDVRTNKRTARVLMERMASQNFDSLDEAVVTAHKIAHTCKAKVIVRGRRGNMHYMCDGNF